MRLDTIIAPTDLEENSLPGLRAAVDLARLTGARVIAIHVLTTRDVDTSTPWHEERPVRARVVEEAEARLRAHLEEHGAGVLVEGRVVWGDPVRAVIEAAASEGADLIVITGKHRSRVGKAIMGSQAQRLILESDRPVLTVPLRHG